MSEDRKAVTPTRVIPAAEWPPVGPAAPPVPPPPPPSAPVAAPPAPEPGPGSLWPTPPTPGPIEVRVVVDLAPPVEEYEPTRRERLAAWATDLLRRIGGPWRTGAALLGAMVPIPGVGYSAATTWSYCVGVVREDWGVFYGYTTALVALGIATAAFRRAPSAPRLAFVIVSGFGLWGALSWYDVIQGLTGVGR